MEKKYGVRSGVEVMLCRLPSLVPHKSGGPFSLFGTDLLHVLDLGVTKKFLAMLDAFMIKFRQKGADSEIQSKEDVRSRVDQVVASVPTHPGELTFDLGWYGGEGDGGGSASENAALLKLTYFAYVSDPGLIYDDERRQRMLRMHKLLIEVGQELRTPQWYLNSEFDALWGKIKFLADEFKWTQSELGAACPRDGMNIPKWYDFMNVVWMLKFFGTLMNADAGAYERRMKSSKEADERTVARSRQTDHTDDLFLTQQTIDLDRRSSATPAAAAEELRPSRSVVTTAGQRRGVVGRGLNWELVVRSLRLGQRGPPVSPELLAGLNANIESFPNREAIRVQSRTLL